MRIVVGLGNPGREYESTRHNIGFMVVQKFAESRSFSFGKKKFRSELASGTFAGESILLVKPQTFMNLTGEAVGPLVRFYNVAPSDLLVIYDDIDLPFGRLRLRLAGGTGGHKGMKSIVSHLGTEEFPRLRIGIRGEAPPNDLSAYVLRRFKSEETAELGPILSKACEAIEAVLSGPFEDAMNRFN